MIRVAPVKLQVGTKVLWFSPNDLDIHKDDHVVVRTERGVEFGTAASDITEVSEEVIATLKSPLKPVLRVATEEDIEHAAELAQRGEEALIHFKELAAESNEDMHPVAVEFLFDDEKAIFYFEAEERIDFRDLVRKLAGRFHVRVDMRQIGVRDGARIIGGLGHCGQELCCKRMGGDFMPVTIRMAKEQNLSLNPQKISGVCGRLMCCLRYEFETYKEVNARAPKHGAKIEVPGGVAKVTEINVPHERVTLLLEDGKTIKVPLSEMEYPEEGKRPNAVSEEVFEKYASPDPLEMLGASTFEVASFTGKDKLAETPTCPCKQRGGRGEKQDDAQKDQGRKPRRRRRSSGSSDSEASKKPQEKQQKRSAGQKPESGASESGRKPRRRRSSGAKQQPAAEGQQRTKQQRPASQKPSSKNSGKGSGGPRPGQRSSGVRNAPSKPRSNQGKQAGSTPSGAPADSMHRKPRRRRQKAAGGEQVNENAK